MESRKIVLMILFERQQRACKHKEQTFWHSGGRRGWDVLGEYHWNIYITVCKIDSLWKFSVWCREPKFGALWQPRGVGWGRRLERGSRGRGLMYIYGRFMLMYGRNQHNIVIILSVKIKWKRKDLMRSSIIKLSRHFDSIQFIRNSCFLRPYP